MSGWNPLCAEIVFGLDNAPAEILLPDAIDDHSRGERVVRGNNPSGEIETVESIRCRAGARTPARSWRFSCWFANEPALQLRNGLRDPSALTTALSPLAVALNLDPSPIGWAKGAPRRGCGILRAWSRFEGRQYLRDARGDPLARPSEISFDEHVRFSRLGKFLHHQRGDRSRLPVEEFGQPRLALLELRIVAAKGRVNSALLPGRPRGKRHLDRLPHGRLELGGLLRRQRLLPFLDRAAMGVEIAIQVFLEFGDFLLDAVRRFEFAGHFQHPHRRSFAVPVFALAVEEGKHSVIVALRERIKLVIVALGTAQGDAQEDRGRRVDAIQDTLDAELLGIDAA